MSMYSKKYILCDTIAGMSVKSKKILFIQNGIYKNQGYFQHTSWQSRMMNPHALIYLVIFDYSMYYCTERHGNTLFTSTLAKFSCIVVAKTSTYCFTWFNNLYYVSRIFFDIVCHSKQRWSIQIIVARYFNELTFMTWVKPLCCSVNLFFGKCNDTLG